MEDEKMEAFPSLSEEVIFSKSELSYNEIMLDIARVRGALGAAEFMLGLILPTESLQRKIIKEQIDRLEVITEKLIRRDNEEELHEEHGF